MKSKVTLESLLCWVVLLLLTFGNTCHAALQGPIITSATFTSDGRKVIGVFNMETDRAGYPVFHQFDCNQLVQPWTTMQFGEGSYCVWTSNSVLEMVIGFGSTLDVNWNIGILPYKLAPLNGGPLQDSQTFLNPPPNGFDLPMISIVGPNILGGCEEYVHYWIDNTGGLAASVEPYFWHIEPTGLTPNITEQINSYFSTSNNFVSIDSSQVPVGTYTISVTVTNRFGGTGVAFLDIERRDDSITTPVTHIDGATFFTITPSQPLTLKGAVTQTCASTNLKLSWSQSDGEPLPTNVIFPPSHHLYVPSRSLTYGNYTFKFMTTLGDSTQPTSESFVNVLVVPDTPIVTITPSNLVIATSASFTLDASTSRVAPNSVFVWTCYNSQNPTVACMEPFFSNQVFGQPQQYIDVPSHALRSSGNFIFQVAVTDPYGVTTKTTTMVNMVSDVPAVQIEAIAVGLQESGLVDPQQGLTLIAHASSPDIVNNSTFTYSWFCPLLSLSQIPSPNPALYLAPSQLSPGQTYTFTANVSGAFGIGSASITLTMNIPAAGGGCTATPLIHYEDGNPFWLECFSFVDDNFPVDNMQSTRYHFHYEIQDGGFEVPLTTIPQSTKGLLATLPIGSSKVIAYIIDATGSTTKLDIPVVVNPPNTTEDYLNEALLLSGELLQQAMNSQDIDAACQLILRTSVLLNAITTSKYETNVTQALRSTLLSLFQSDTNFFSTELGSQSVIQKAYLALNLVPPVYGELTTDLITQAIQVTNYLLDDSLVDDFSSNAELADISLALASRILGSSFPTTNLTVETSPNDYNLTLNVNNDDDFDGVTNPTLKPIVIGNQQTSDALVGLVYRACTLAIANQSPGSTVTTALQTPYIYVGIKKDYPAQIPWYYQYTQTFFIQLPYNITSYMKAIMGDTPIGTALIVYHLNPYAYSNSEATSPVIDLHFYSAENFTEIPYPQMQGTEVEISIPFHSSLNQSICQTWNFDAHKWSFQSCQTILPSSPYSYPYPADYTPVLTCICPSLQITSVSGPAMLPYAIVSDYVPPKSHKKDWAIWVLIIIPIAIIAYFLYRRSHNQNNQNNNNKQPTSEFSNIAPALSVATGAPRRRPIDDDSSDSESEEELHRKNQNKPRDNRRRGHRSDSSRDSRRKRRVDSDSDSNTDSYSNTVSSSSRGKAPKRSGASLGNKGKGKGSLSDLSISGSDSSRDNRKNSVSGVGSNTKRAESESEGKGAKKSKSSKNKKNYSSSESEVEELSKSSKNTVSSTSTSSEDLSKKK